jgi:uncharacterized protein
MITVEVVYALPDRQCLLTLNVEDQCTAFEAVQRSGVDEQFPEIDLANAKLGIFGKVIEQPGQQMLRDGDRIEIYRPLLIDPKAARRERAATKT